MFFFLLKKSQKSSFELKNYVFYSFIFFFLIFLTADPPDGSASYIKCNFIWDRWLSRIYCEVLKNSWTVHGGNTNFCFRHETQSIRNSLYRYKQTIPKSSLSWKSAMFWKKTKQNRRNHKINYNNNGFNLMKKLWTIVETRSSLAVHQEPYKQHLQQQQQQQQQNSSNTEKEGHRRLITFAGNQHQS